LSLAAALVLVIAATFAYREIRDRLAGSDLRALPSDEVTRALGGRLVVDVVEPVGTMRAPPLRFRWRPVNAAREYRLTLSASDGEEIWTGVVATPTAAWPASVSLVDGTYYWQVIALRDGEAIARSPLSLFRIQH
jgi:hypothetical protein